MKQVRKDGKIEGYRAWGVSMSYKRLVPIVGCVRRMYGFWHWEYIKGLPWAEKGVQRAICDVRYVNDKTKYITGTSKHGAVPSPKCLCGFWILKEPKHLIETLKCDCFGVGKKLENLGLLGVTLFETLQISYILGKASGWGRVVEGETGWRTEYAMVEALIDSPVYDVKYLADFYEVPIIDIVDKVND